MRATQRPLEGTAAAGGRLKGLGRAGVPESPGSRVRGLLGSRRRRSRRGRGDACRRRQVIHRRLGVSVVPRLEEKGRELKRQGKTTEGKSRSEMKPRLAANESSAKYRRNHPSDTRCDESKTVVLKGACQLEN